MLLKLLLVASSTAGTSTTCGEVKSAYKTNACCGDSAGKSLSDLTLFSSFCGTGTKFVAGKCEPVAKPWSPVNAEYIQYVGDATVPAECFPENNAEKAAGDGKYVTVPESCCSAKKGLPLPEGGFPGLTPMTVSNFPADTVCRDFSSTLGQGNRSILAACDATGTPWYGEGCGPTPAFMDITQKCTCYGMVSAATSTACVRLTDFPASFGPASNIRWFFYFQGCA